MGERRRWKYAGGARAVRAWHAVDAGWEAGRGCHIRVRRRSEGRSARGIFGRGI
eukprot:COSAG05_NODE_5484_length_1161_cov_3.080979_1_plen_54_part_00